MPYEQSIKDPSSKMSVKGHRGPRARMSLTMLKAQPGEWAEYT